jgi:hypothetical protein
MTDVVNQNKNKVTFAYNTSLPPSPPNHDAILDSGTTGNYLTVGSPVTNLAPTPNGVRAKIPDGKILQATHKCELRLPALLPKAQAGHVFQKFHNPLISVALLCDNGCEVNFTKTNVNVKLGTKTILTGYCEPSTGHWRVKLDDQQQETEPANGHANSIVPVRTIADTVQFLHMACFSPSTSTLIRAVENGSFAIWPMFTSANIKKHLPKSEATTLGHLNQKRKNTQSIKRTEDKNSAACKTPTHHATTSELHPIPIKNTTEPE